MRFFVLKWIPLLLLASFFVLQGCASEDTTGVTDDEIVIGSWGPLTGPAALWGAVPRGMDAYFQMINEEGGIHGRQIRFIYRDDGYEPPRTVSAVRQMVQNDQVFAFVGGVGTAPGMAVKNFILDNQIPWVSPASGSTHWAYPPQDNLFSTFPLYTDDAAIQINYAVEELGLSRFAIIYQNDDYGRGGLIGAEMALEKHGLEFVTRVSTEIMDSDLTSHAARLRESGAEAVLLWVLPRQAAIITGTTAVMGYRPQWIASSTLSDMPLMYDITDGRWEGVIFTTFGEMHDSDSELAVRYRQALATHQPGERWGTFSAAGFIFAEPMVQALRDAGPDLTRESFVEAMANIHDFQGIGAPISFSDGRQGTRSLYLVRCTGPLEYEILSDYISSDLDINEAISRLGVRR